MACVAGRLGPAAAAHARPETAPDDVTAAYGQWEGFRLKNVVWNNTCVDADRSAWWGNTCPPPAPTASPVG